MVPEKGKAREGCPAYHPGQSGCRGPRRAPSEVFFEHEETVFRIRRLLVRRSWGLRPRRVGIPRGGWGDLRFYADVAEHPHGGGTGRGLAPSRTRSRPPLFSESGENRASPILSRWGAPARRGGRESPPGASHQTSHHESPWGPLRIRTGGDSGSGHHRPAGMGIYPPAVRS